MVRVMMLVVLMFSAIVPPLAATPAYACSCAPPIPAETESYADVIAIGTVVRVDMPSEGLFGTHSSLDPAFVSVAVERYLKGSGGADLTLSTARSGASCGALGVLEVGERFLLFLRGDATNYTTGLCSGNIALDSSEGADYLREIVAITGPGSVPDGQPDAPIDPVLEAEPRITLLGLALFSPWMALVTGIVGILALLPAALLFRRVNL